MPFARTALMDLDFTPERRPPPDAASPPMVLDFTPDEPPAAADLPPAGETANPPAPPGLTTREIVLGAVGLFATAAVTLTLLTARPARTSAAPAAETPADARPAAAPVAAPVEPGAPLWSSANRASWLADPRKGIAYEVAADNLVSVWMRTVRPTLVVRCLARRVDAFVVTESAAAIETNTEDHTVTLRFDNEPESRERWADSSDHDALFAPDGIAFARRLMRASTLQFGFTPHNAASAVAQFRVHGLGDLLHSAARECGGKS